LVERSNRAVGARGAGGGIAPPPFLEDLIHFTLKNAVFEVNLKVSPPSFSELKVSPPSPLFF